MEVLEKAKKALRKHLLENKKDVVNDLAEMREKSSGISDMRNYIDHLSTGLSLGEVQVKKNVIYEISYQDIESYLLQYEELTQNIYAPPQERIVWKDKNDSETLTESFFL